MKTIEERAESVAIFKKFGEGMDEKDVVLHNILIQGRREGYIKGATDQKNIDHSEEHLAWILQEYFKWRESNNPKVSFGEWISVSME